ncbi:hypothetical protein D5086_032007, partial [Populus alba]
ETSRNWKKNVLLLLKNDDTPPCIDIYLGLTWILSADVALSDWNALWAIRFED